ncbi:hypothetical protein J4447_04385 [Candidatus Pacearchaeota archaeon]|nr:hypothetical protein [Candidatus Pacearchaeota archaeon]
MTLVRKMTAKRGSGRKKIIVIIGIISIIILAFMLARPGTSGLAIYNLGSFDSSNSLTSWSENEADGDGDFVDYSVDTTAYYSGGGSLRGASERGAGRNWSGEYLYKAAPITTPQQNNVYINFYWRKSYDNSTPNYHRMYIAIKRPDNSKPIIWEDSSQTWNSWNQVSIEASNYFNQNGNYEIQLHCDLVNGNATGDSRSLCWYDEFTVDVQNDSQGGGGGASPVFYSYIESPANNSEYSPSITYEFKVSVTNSDGSVWADFDNLNRTMASYSGNSYRFLIPNLSAGIHSFYYWGWSAGIPKARNASEKRYYEVKRAGSDAKMIINGVRGSAEAINGSLVCLSAEAPYYADGLRTLYVNGEIYGNMSGNFQNCTIFNNFGNYNASAHWDGGTNYVGDWEGWQLKIVREQEAYLRQNPIIKIISPENKTYQSGTKEINFSLKSSIELKECRYSLDGRESAVMNKTNSTDFAIEKVDVSGKLSHQVLFVCKDNFGNVYNVQPLVIFSIDKESAVASDEPEEEEQEKIINEGRSCFAVWKCTQWSDCSGISYDIGDVIKGRINVSGERRRVCYDTQLCESAKIERERCDISIPVETKAGEWCGENYVEVYEKDGGKIVSRVREEKSGLGDSKRRRVDVGFVISEIGDYCDYCYNDIKDFDETGIDCGGQNCPSCSKITSNAILSGNHVKAALTALEIVFASAILSFLFYWFFVRRLMHDEEEDMSEADKAAELVKGALAKGYSKQQVIELFRKKNWSDYEIDEIFRRIGESKNSGSES